jgi:hypothetical protein
MDAQHGPNLGWRDFKRLLAGLQEAHRWDAAHGFWRAYGHEPRLVWSGMTDYHVVQYVYRVEHMFYAELHYPDHVSIFPVEPVPSYDFKVIDQQDDGW